mgnify:CR=1 FL=1
MRQMRWPFAQMYIILFSSYIIVIFVFVQNLAFRGKDYLVWGTVLASQVHDGSCVACLEWLLWTGQVFAAGFGQTKFVLENNRLCNCIVQIVALTLVFWILVWTIHLVALRLQRLDGRLLVLHHTKDGLLRLIRLWRELLDFGLVLWRRINLRKHVLHITWSDVNIFFNILVVVRNWICRIIQLVLSDLIIQLKFL